jgi:hypothetical protein
MKTTGYHPGMILLMLLLLLSGTVHADPQPSYTGTWEGKFMGDFRTTIQILSADNGLTGTIKMYSGPQLIQDDPITDIAVEGKQLTFQIPAKETSFIGEFDEEVTLLKGKFIFPDGSEHPLEVQKNSGEANGFGSGEALYSESRERRFSADALREDLQVLMKALEENHPRLYSYTSKEKMTAACEGILAEIDGSMSLEEYFRLIAPLVGLVGCSHTGIRYPAEYASLLAAQGGYFPLEVRCHQGCIYYMSAAVPPPSGISPGTEISRINGLPATEVIDRITELVPTEGFNPSAAYYQLNRDFQELYRILDPAELFEVEFKGPDGLRKEVLQACKLQEFGHEKLKDPGEVPVSFRLVDQGYTGILKVPAFEIRNMEAYMEELNRIFSQLQEEHTGKLILDLRGNPGGHPIFAAQLLSYLVDEDFTYFKRNPEATEFEPLYGPMHPDPLHFSGKLYVLVDGGCLSTTGHLISLIKYHTDALFIGEEPGSTFRCNDFSTQVILPHTGIEANIPRMTFETAVKGFQEGIPFPLDYPVQFSISDIVNGIDSMMVLGQELAVIL